MTKEGGLGGPWPRHYRYPYHERGELYSRAISSFKGFLTGELHHTMDMRKKKRDMCNDTRVDPDGNNGLGGIYEMSIYRRGLLTPGEKEHTPGVDLVGVVWWDRLSYFFFFFLSFLVCDCGPPSRGPAFWEISGFFKFSLIFE